jgi:hypothetical protein
VALRDNESMHETIGARPDSMVVIEPGLCWRLSIAKPFEIDRKLRDGSNNIDDESIRSLYRTGVARKEKNRV